MDGLARGGQVSSLLDGMNPEQERVVRHVGGPLAVRAVAGAGKTRALVHRLARLVLEEGVDPDRILAVTFSKKAADEMAERVEALGVEGGQIQTWHSLCLRILKEDYVREGAWEIDSKDRAKGFLKEAVGYKHMNWAPKDFGALRSFIGLCKAHLWAPDAIETLVLAQRKFGPRDAGNCVRAYAISQDLIEQSGFLTFDDMLVYAHRHLLDDRNAESWAGRWDFVLQDEAQDASPAQIAIAKRLVGTHRNYMIVGDFFQCIPAGQKIATPSGEVPIEEVKEGDMVLAVKAGLLVPRKILRKSCSRKESAFEFDLGEYGKFRATKEHILFAALDSPNGAFVYLMYRADMGYRIGVSRTVRDNGKNFVVRTQQEGAERLWVLAWFPSYVEGAEAEAHWAYKWGVPREPFNPRAGMWSGDVHATSRLFSQFGKNGRKLLEDQKLDFDRPNYFAKATIRGSGRIAINLVMCTKDGHQIEVETQKLSRPHDALFGMSVTKNGGLRLRKCFRNIREARSEADRLAKELDGYVVESLSCAGANRRMLGVPAASVNVGMMVPISDGEGGIKSVPILSRSEVACGDCFDLEVEDLGNFLTNGVVVHNSIYQFRGASPETMLSFPKEWLGTTVVEVNRNYRSGEAIIRAANAVLEPAAVKERVPMVAERGIEGKVRVIRASSLDDEAGEFVAHTRSLLAGGTSPEEIFCLYRTNAQSRALEAALLKTKIPYVIVGGTNFYERKEVKDLLAYLRTAVDPDADSVRRCINAPFRFLGAAFVGKVNEIAAEGECDDWQAVVMAAAEKANIQHRQRASATEWVELIQRVKKSDDAGESPAEILRDLVARTRYVEWLEKEEGGESIEASHGANVRELCRVAEQFDSVREFLGYVTRNLQEAAKQRRGHRSRVTLMSIHKSKGLEAEHVWVVGCNEKVLPHAKGDPEEERRLMYVAVTRARDELTLSYVTIMSMRNGSTNVEPSRFLKDMGLVAETREENGAELGEAS